MGNKQLIMTLLAILFGGYACSWRDSEMIRSVDVSIVDTHIVNVIEYAISVFPDSFMHTNTISIFNEENTDGFTLMVNNHHNTDILPERLYYHTVIGNTEFYLSKDFPDSLYRATGDTLSIRKNAISITCEENWVCLFDIVTDERYHMYFCGHYSSDDTDPNVIWKDRRVP